MESRKVVTANDVRQIIALLEARYDATEDVKEEFTCWERLMIARAELERLTGGEHLRAKPAHPGPPGA